MKSIEVTGKNVDDAIAKALQKLNVSKDEIEYEVIDEGSKGLFNFIGSKPAKLVVSLKKNYIDNAKEFLVNVLNSTGIEPQIKITEEGNTIKIDLEGIKMGNVIGYRGETLDSLQYLLSLVINKNHEIPYKRVVLDVENYRLKREETLKRVAEKTAYKVKKISRAYKLEPMNPYERRIIHSALQDKEGIFTYSEGEEPYRRVVVDIKPKK